MKLLTLIFWLFIGIFCAMSISDVIGHGGHRKRGHHGHGGGRYWRPRNGTRWAGYRNRTQTS
uniref:Hypothetical secreted peptide n=1 Tax=Simulium guianense TaxID=445764 RepID=F5GTX7_SIMGU